MSIDSPNPTQKGSKLACILLLSGLVLAGGVFLAASFIPFSVLQAKVRGMSASGKAPFFDETFYAGMQLRLRMIGLADLVIAGFGIGMRRRIYRIAQRVWEDSIQFGGDVKAAARSVPRTDLLGLALLTVLGALLRIPLLSQPMREDEASTFAEYIARPFYVTLSFYNGPDNHLFHTLLVRFSYLLFGNHPWDLRLPAVLAGMCLVPATYVASRCLYRTESGLLAAGLVASSSILVEFSTNARGYGLFALEVLVLTALAAYTLRHQNWAAWFLLAVLAAVGFYTMPIMLYAFGGIAVWLLLCAGAGDAAPEARSLIVGLMAAAGLGAFATLELYSPVFAVSGPRAVFANKWVKANPFTVFLHNVPVTLASTWKQWGRDVPWLVMLLLAAGFLIALVFHRRYGRQRVPLAVAMLSWIAPVVLIQRVAPYERVWLFALPLFCIMASAGVALAVMPGFERLGWHRAMFGVAIVASLLMGLHVQRNRSVLLSNEGRGMEDIALYLQGRLHEGDSVIVELPSDGPLHYYFNKHGVPARFLNAPTRRRVLVVVNEVSGDTVAKVIELALKFHRGTMLMNLDAGSARLLVKYDSACLYEISEAQRETSQRL